MSSIPNIRLGSGPVEPWWPKALDAARSEESPSSDEQSLEVLARRRDPKKVARAALASAESAFASDDYAHFRQNYLMAWEMVRGQQWPPHLFEDAESWKIRVTRNKLFAAMRQIEALLIDMTPEGILIPRRVGGKDGGLGEAMRRLGLEPLEVAQIVNRPSDREVLDDATRLIQDMQEDREEHLHFGNLVADMVVGGYGVEKVFWNDDLRIVDTKQLYPLDVAFDPDCRSKLRRGCKYIVIRHETDLEDVLERFDPPRSVVSKLRAGAGSSFDRLYSEPDVPIKEVYDSLEYTSSGARELVKGTLKRDKVRFYEIYYLGDRSFDAEHSKVPSGELSAGRVVSVAKDLDEPLYDGPNPDPDGQCPLVFYDNYGFGHSPYPFGEVEPNLGNQIALNIIMSVMAMNGVLNQNAQWLVEEGVLTGDDPDNRPGGIYEIAANKMGRLQRLPGVETPASLFNLGETLAQAITDVLNVNDMTMGGAPQTHVPAYALQMAQTMNLAPMRRKGKMLEAGWRRRTRLQANLVFAYGSIISGVQDYPALRDYLQVGGRSEHLPFKVKVVSKTERPIGFIGEMQFALDAFKNGLIDRLGVVNFVTDYPIDPELKGLLEVERQTALLQAQINLATKRAEHAQIGASQDAPTSGPMAPTVSAGIQPAKPEEAQTASPVIPAPANPLGA